MLLEDANGEVGLLAQPSASKNVSQVAQPIFGSPTHFYGFTPVGPQVSLCKRPEKLSFLGEQGVPLSKSENIFTKSPVWFSL
jgi:hypothetical protein